MARPRALENMSYAELAELREDLDTALDAARIAEKQKIRAQMESMAKRSGLSLADIIKAPRGQSKMKGTKVAPKYRNPQNPEQTWAGRGRQPIWLTNAIKKGRKLESFKI
jgi:DNA-binding protein H-NS